MLTTKHKLTLQNEPEEQKDLKISQEEASLGRKHERITDPSLAVQPKLTDSDLAFIKKYESKIKELLTDEIYTHIGLRYTVGNYYKEMVMRLCSQLIEEYNCKTPSEIGLAEIAASSLAKYLDYSELLSLTSHKPFNSMTSSSFSALSKEVDRSQRAYISAILTLKQLKNPPIEVKIKTTNAFIANNQQVNSGR